LTGKQLLIVDDNATNRLILARPARAWGMQARAATSGQEALAWLSRGDLFDLVILDMQMPEMDGLTLAAEIRRLEEERRSSSEPLTVIPWSRSSKLPLVMLTSLGRREDSELMNQIEFAAFLTKPIKSAQLYNILLNIFEGQPIYLKSHPIPSALDPQLGQSHPLRILLAEDNAVNQKVALHMLERLGYRADIAANGLEAIEALRRQAYDVILMDMQMPEMDGLEATRYIHTHWPAEQHPWIIAMTANALQGDRERCLEAGMNDYVSKPVRPEELARALSQCPPSSRAGEAARVAIQPVRKVTPESLGNEGQLNQNGPVLEASALAELRQLLGKEASKMIPELIDLFFVTAEPLVEEIRSAVQNEASDKLFRAAHTLRPGSAHLGAARLAALCAELEAIGKSGQLAGAATKLADFEAEFSRVKVALEAEKTVD
jgi:CheY-like chemotaxis protein